MRASVAKGLCCPGASSQEDEGTGRPESGDLLGPPVPLSLCLTKAASPQGWLVPGFRVPARAGSPLSVFLIVVQEHPVTVAVLTIVREHVSGITFTRGSVVIPTVPKPFVTRLETNAKRWPRPQPLVYVLP